METPALIGINKSAASSSHSEIVVIEGAQNCGCLFFSSLSPFIRVAASSNNTIRKPERPGQRIEGPAI